MTEITVQQQETIQSIKRRDAEAGWANLVLWLAGTNELAPNWWSPTRDDYLRRFWRSVDYLAGAVFTLEARLATIPFKVIAKDQTIEAHQDQAEKFQALMEDGAEFGAGWSTFFSKWNEELLTQDNGAFCEIIGPGDPTGPITGMPLGFAVLDSARCIRTSSPEFPVLYVDNDGKKHKLHFTRVAFESLQSSPIATMNGVGLCAVSRCLNIAQNMLDIMVYKQEKLGSRPHRGLMVTGGGLDPDDITAAMALADEAMDSQLLTRYSKMAVVGHADMPDATIEMHDLTSLPDGFVEQDAISLGMSAIALAFGVDARELWPMTGSGATRADALIQHLKSRQKGIGQLIQIAETTIGPKLLPPHLKLVFDYQDDAQDRAVAEIKKVRSDRHQVDLNSESVDVRTVREQMMADGDLTQAQFEELELTDGRLPDGSPIVTLFYDPDYASMLNLGLPDPLSVDINDIETIRQIVKEKRAELIKALALMTNHRQRRMIREALMALNGLIMEYQQDEGEKAIARMNEEMEDDEGRPPDEEDDPESDDQAEQVDDDTEEADDTELEGGETEGPFEVKSLDSYRMAVRASIRAYWSGEWDFMDFIDGMSTAIFRGFESAWREGASECGIRPSDRTVEEQSRLDQEIMNDVSRLTSLSDYVSQNSKANGGLLRTSMTRGELWINRYNAVKSIAQRLACADQKFEWQLGATEQHCRDCAAYAGRVHRGSVWASVGARPQSGNLECGGWRCDCRLVPTTANATPGRPPRPSGG